MSESTWLTLDRIGIVCGILAFLGTAYSAFRWWQHQQQERRGRERIPIRLVSAEDGRLLHALPFQPPRRSVTRAEVQGLLGNIPSAEAGKRFEWKWLHRADFMQHLEEVHHGQRDVLEIPISAEEFAQLDLPRTI